MKLEEYAIDDLHQMALAEFEGDEAAGRALNAKYDALLRDYIEEFKRLRAKAEERES